MSKGEPTRCEIHPRIKPLDLAQLIISSLEGAILLSRLENFDPPATSSSTSTTTSTTTSAPDLESVSSLGTLLPSR